MNRDDSTKDPDSRFAGAAVPGAPLGNGGGGGGSGGGGGTRSGKGRVAGADRSIEVLGTLEHEPGDRLTCRRVFGDYYRCNWWARGAGAAAAAGPVDPHMICGLEVATYRVRKSRLMKATVAEGRVVVEDATNRAVG